MGCDTSFVGGLQLKAAVLLVLVFTRAARSDESEATAVALLRGVENARRTTQSFSIDGVVRRVLGDEAQERPFLVEYSEGKYRIRSGSAVAIYDGSQLYCYDGRESAVVMPPHQRCVDCLAFDPRALGVSTGLYSDLSLEENIAYRLGKEIAVVRPGGGGDDTALTRIKWIDRHSQRVEMEIQPHPPYRVSYYAKMIPDDSGEGIFATYVTESEFWDDDAMTWLPRKLVMYTIDGQSPETRTDQVEVVFQKPVFGRKFAADNWTYRSLEMPIGQPLVDLKAKQRIGYWDGAGLAETPPLGRRLLIDDKNARPASQWLIIANIVAMIVIALVVLLRRGKPRQSR